MCVIIFHLLLLISCVLLGQARQCRQVYDPDTGREETPAAARRLQVRNIAHLRNVQANLSVQGVILAY
jgi:hypothetical protein